MKLSIKTFFLLFFLLVGWTGSCFAGAWTMKKGSFYNRFAFNNYYADENFDNNGDKVDFVDDGSFRDLNLNYYLEYGLTDRTTLVTSLYYKKLKREDDFREDKTWGLGDVDLGLKYKFWERDAGVVSLQALAKIPDAYDEDETLPLGDGNYDLELRLLYGRSLWPYLHGYLNLEAAYRWRSGSAADQVRYLAEFGLDFTEALYGRAKLDGTLGLDSGDEAGQFDENPTATEDYDLGKLDLALGYKLNSNWGVELGYAPALYGENTAAGATWTAALIWQTP